MTFAITFSELWTYAPDDPQRRLPVANLSEDGGGHVHGRLELQVAGRKVPSLGYWGPSDACFGQWLQVLREALNELGKSSNAEYIFDEGEQGQPAFRWRRKDQSLTFSIVDSTISDGKANPDWQEVECSYEDFVREVEAFHSGFSATLLRDAPDGGEAWLENHIRNAT